jgi:hypothetical protein
MLLEFSADLREAVPSPHSTIIRFTEAVDSARTFESPRHVLWRLVRFAKHLNHDDRSSVQVRP